MRIEAVDGDRILPLRHAVLRAGLPREEARFAHDDAATSAHFAAIDGEDDVVGCVTLMRRPLDGTDAWQLRGMAVADTHRGRRVGAALLHAVDRHVRQYAAERGTPLLLWCNARAHAVGFYERHGWTTISERFEVPHAGPHYRMRKVLDASQPRRHVPVD